MYRPHGIITALITPFKNGQIDFESLENLVKHQLKNGINGFVINGTTAESPNLDEDEVAQIFSFVKKLVPKDFPLIVGSGSNSTKKTIAATKKAESLGAHAALVVVPYYNKPTQEGLRQHFTAVADSSSLPIILYNVPSRTITSLSAQTCIELSNHKNIVGVKEASGDMKVSEEIRKSASDGFSLLSGDDGTYLQQTLLGGNGCISVLSHILPKQCVDWFTKTEAKDKTVLETFKRFETITNLLFKEPNPAPVKYALKKMGIIASDEVRLPLVSCSEPLQQEIDTHLKKLELL